MRCLPIPFIALIVCLGGIVVAAMALRARYGRRDRMLIAGCMVATGAVVLGVYKLAPWRGDYLLVHLFGWAVRIACTLAFGFFFVVTVVRLIKALPGRQTKEACAFWVAATSVFCTAELLQMRWGTPFWHYTVMNAVHTVLHVVWAVATVVGSVIIPYSFCALAGLFINTAWSQAMRNDASLPKLFLAIIGIATLVMLIIHGVCVLAGKGSTYDAIWYRLELARPDWAAEAAAFAAMDSHPFLSAAPTFIATALGRCATLP